MKNISIRIFLVLVFSLTCVGVGAQSHSRSKAFYGELFGASQGVGLNYDARFKRDAPDGLGWRAGLGFGYASSSLSAFYSIDGESIQTYNQMFRLAVPLELNYLLGKGKSKFESGVGAAFCLDRFTSNTGAQPKYSFGFIPYLSLGYRLVTDKGFLFRAGVLPIFVFSTPNKLNLYPYLGFGRAF